MAPVQRRVAAAADDKGKEKSGLSWRNIPTKKQVLMRLEHQLKDPSFLGVLIAWLPVAISGYAVYYVGSASMPPHTPQFFVLATLPADGLAHSCLSSPLSLSLSISLSSLRVTPGHCRFVF